jgi:hypothetical protein
MVVTKNSIIQMAEDMRRRTVTLSDGRYLIFYEFGPTAANEVEHEPAMTGSNPVIEEESV